MKAEPIIESFGKAELIVKNWAVTKCHRQAAEFLLRENCGLRDEVLRLDRLVEKYTPKVDSVHLFGTDDAEKLRQQGREDFAGNLRAMTLRAKNLAAAVDVAEGKARHFADQNTQLQSRIGQQDAEIRKLNLDAAKKASPSRVNKGARA